MSIQERRGSKNASVPRSRGSLEEVRLRLSIADKSKISYNQVYLLESSKHAKKGTVRKDSSQRSPKRGSMNPKEKEKKLSTVEKEYTTGDSYCDLLIRRINDGQRRRLDEHYTLKEKLGEGAFAKVYSGIDKETGKKYALKIISLDTSEFEKQALKKNIIGRSKEDVLKRRQKIVKNKLTLLLKSIDTEVYILKQVSNFSVKELKSLVKIKEVFGDSSQIVVVMELLNGGELFERIAEKNSEYSEKDAAYILKKICKGLKALHSNGIIHRDLKPENIVFDNLEENAKIKITDFGLAFNCKSGTRDIFDNVIVGSPAYIAPEILTHKLYTYACDIWSLGCILFILLFGYPPFQPNEGDSGHETLFEKIKQGLVNFPKNESEISSEAKDLLMKMLNIDPRERLTAVQVLKHPWLSKKAKSAELKYAFGQMKAFNARRKLKKWALQLVVNSKQGKGKVIKELLLNTVREDGFSGEELLALRDHWFKLADNELKITLSDFKLPFENLQIFDLPFLKLFSLFLFTKKKETGKEKIELKTKNKKKSKLVEEEEIMESQEIFENEEEREEEEDEEEEEEGRVFVADVCVGFATVGKGWTGKDALRFCFDTYDRNGNGKISKQDVRKILKIIFGEKSFQPLAGIFKSLLKKTTKVSFNDFSNNVLKSGDNEGGRGMKEKLFNPMTSIVKNMSKISYRQVTRISTSMSIASKRSMTRMNLSFDQRGHGHGRLNILQQSFISDERSEVDSIMEEQSLTHTKTYQESSSMSIVSPKQAFTLPRALVTRETLSNGKQSLKKQKQKTRERQKSLLPVPTSTGSTQQRGSRRGTGIKKRKKGKPRFFSFRRGTSKKSKDSQRSSRPNSRGAASTSVRSIDISRGRVRPRKAYLIRRVPNSDQESGNNNLYKPEQKCKQEFDITLEWGDFQLSNFNGNNKTLRDGKKSNPDSFADPRRSLMLKMKEKIQLKHAIEEKSSHSLHTESTLSDSEDSL